MINFSPSVESHNRQSSVDVSAVHMHLGPFGVITISFGPKALRPCLMGIKYAV